MLLNNFRLACNNATTICPTGATTDQTISISQNNTTYGYYKSNTNGWYVDVGFGNTAENINDYKLDDDNINFSDNTTVLTHLGGACYANAPSIRTVISSYRNDTENNITVTEIGMLGKTGGSTNYPRRNTLIARKVLATPVVITPGSTVAFTYSIDMNLNESVETS